MIGQQRFQTYFERGEVHARFSRVTKIKGALSIQPDWDAIYDATAERFEAVMLAVSEKLMRDDDRD